MHSYAKSLKAHLARNADPVQAAPMKKYMRDQFEYVGIKSPQMKTLIREFMADHGKPPVAQLDKVIIHLWSLPEREYQYAAIELLKRSLQELPGGFIQTIQYMLVTKSWWDTVDAISTRPLGVHFRRFPRVREGCIIRWRVSENFWLRRALILFQLNYRSETDFRLLGELIRENLGSDEFFINKAIGWALRQYARTDPEAVREFLKATPLHPLSRREALKHLNRK